MFRANCWKMTKRHPLSKFAFVLAVLCVLYAEDSRAAKISHPGEEDLVRLGGDQMSAGISKVIWNAAEPPQTNLLIYGVEPFRHDRKLLVKLADYFGIKGEVQPLPPDSPMAPGYWIKQPNSTNWPWFKAVSVSEKSGAHSYGGDESDYKWDQKEHKPLVRGVPSPERALAKTLELLPLFQISTNDLEHTPDGKLRWRYTTEGTTYNDRNDGQKKRFIRRINVMLWQRVHDGAATVSIGGGGMFEVGFISEEHIAEIQFLFRQLRAVGSAKPMTRKQVISQLEGGKVRSFEPGPNNLTVTNCLLAYPQHNGDHKQEFVWPFYQVRGFSVDKGGTNAVSLVLPLDW
jgi:hypothetical protein